MVPHPHTLVLGTISHSFLSYSPFSYLCRNRLKDLPLSFLLRNFPHRSFPISSPCCSHAFPYAKTPSSYRRSFFCTPTPPASPNLRPPSLPPFLPSSLPSFLRPPSSLPPISLTTSISPFRTHSRVTAPRPPQHTDSSSRSRGLSLWSLYNHAHTCTRARAHSFTRALIHARALSSTPSLAGINAGCSPDERVGGRERGIKRKRREGERESKLCPFPLQLYLSHSLFLALHPYPLLASRIRATRPPPARRREACAYAGSRAPPAASIRPSVRAAPCYPCRPLVRPGPCAPSPSPPRPGHPLRLMLPSVRLGRSTRTLSRCRPRPGLRRAPCLQSATPACKALRLHAKRHACLRKPRPA